MQRRGHSIFKAVDLVIRSLTGKLSEEEERELERVKEDTGLGSCAGELFDRGMVVERLRQEEPLFDTGEAYTQFRSRVGRKAPRRITHWAVRAAVWVLPLMAGGGALWYMLAKDAGQQAEVVADIHPVEKKAVVVLANGQRVDLSTGVEEIAEQDGTIIQRDSGRLVYDGSRVGAKGAALYNTLNVPRGGEYTLVLADGTRVALNSGTQLRFPVRFDGGSREVYLSGEAYFTVARDETRPFIVHASRGKVNVLGTAFNVRDYADEARVVTTLVNGAVRYDAHGNGRNVMLRPGFQVADNGELTVREVRVQEYVGWKDGLYIFNNLTLEEMMKTVERNYDVTVFFTHERLKQLRFSGDLKKYDRVESFLRFIETGGDVSFVVKGRTITVQPK